MRKIVFSSVLLLSAIVSQAFTLNTNYRDGYVGSGTDQLGNVVTMGPVAKIDANDAALTSLQ